MSKNSGTAPAEEATPKPPTIENFILDLGNTVLALKKLGIHEQAAVKLVDVSLGYHLANKQLFTQNEGFPFPAILNGGASEDETSGSTE